MTRVNVGITPEEICDQMLIAEIHELPRCFTYSEAHPRAPQRFTLGTGHVLWCARYQLALRHRLEALTVEARRRGFNATFQPCTTAQGRIWGAEDLALARGLLQARIQDRLGSMRRTPTWTRRSRPDWTLLARAS